MGKPRTEAATAKAGPTGTRFVVLAWLCGAAALAYVSRNAIAVAESTVRGDLGLSKEQSGWLMSAFFFSYALMSIPAAQFAQRVGSRRALPLFATVWSIATALLALVSGIGTAIAARIVQGIAQAGLVPAATVTVAKWFPSTGRAFAAGALGSFMSVGGALCAWLTGGLLEAMAPHVAPGWNWRLTFLLFAVPGLLWAVWFWSWFRDEPDLHPAVNEAELELIRGEPATKREQTRRSAEYALGARTTVPLPIRNERGENSPKPIARLEPLNHPLTRPSGTLSPTVREGWGAGQPAADTPAFLAAEKPLPPPPPPSSPRGGGGESTRPPTKTLA